MTSYTVIYRTGGTERCEWRRCLPVATMAEAVSQKESIERSGYKALIHRTKELGAIGMPEGWDAASYSRVAIQKVSDGFQVNLDGKEWTRVSYLPVAEKIADNLSDEIARGVNHRITK